jgi:ribosomal protein L37AE/L43A
MDTTKNTIVKRVCPKCSSTDVKDISPRKDNGIIGPGYKSWKIVDMWLCNQCGERFIV